MSLKVFLKYTIDEKTNSVELLINQTISVGRSSSADIKIQDERLSTIHCTFTLKFDRLVITDKNSKNGTFLNRIRFENADMFVGDEVRIGLVKFTLDLSKMNDFSKTLLTFPGPNQNTVIQNLKLDFTGARIQNQIARVRNNNIMSLRSSSHFQNREVEIRKMANSSSRVTKEQIKSQHRMRASFAALFDLIFALTTLAIPLIILNTLISAEGVVIPGITIDASLLTAQRGTLVICSEAVLTTLFFLLNFKILKFSFGEKLAGIQRKYQKQ